MAVLLNNCAALLAVYLLVLPDKLSASALGALLYALTSHPLEGLLFCHISSALLRTGWYIKLLNKGLRGE